VTVTVTKKNTNETAAKPSVIMEAEVARRIRQHGRSSMKAEICGVLIGSEQGRTTIVEACISGVNAAQGGAHVTFTQDTWEHIYKIKDKLYPEDRIVGWYHSHPGFGVFLSDHDMFIQENFFSSPQQIAWVYDPHSDEEGCFGWCNKKVEKLDDVSFRFLAEKSTTAEHQIDEDDEVEAPDDESGEGSNKKKNEGWVDLLLTVLMYCFVFAFGGLAGAFAWSWVTSKTSINKMDLVENFIVIPKGLVDQPLNECLQQFNGRLQIRLRQQQGLNEFSGSGNLLQPETQQFGTPGTPQSGIFDAPQAGVPLSGGSNNSPGSSANQQSGQTKGGQDGAKR
jgi:proteasome lid subunit RPN8/RPN11